MIKHALVFIASLFLTIQSYAIGFVEDGNLVGCGTVVSVRNTNQYPLYNFEFQEYAAANNVSSGEFAGFLAGNGLVGASAAVVGSLLFDTAVNSNKPRIQPPRDGKFLGHKLLAVKIMMDDDREINVPLFEARIVKFMFKTIQGTPIEPGSRIYVLYDKVGNSKKFGMVQSPLGSAPEKGHPDCNMAVPKEIGDSVIKSMEHMVDESLIINTNTD